MTIDKQKLKELAQAVADLEDIPEREDEHAEAVDALWLNVHCHTILALLAEIERIGADRKACWEEFKVQGRRLDQLKAENEALRDGANFRAIQSLRADCEALRKDAERLDWIDDNYTGHGGGTEFNLRLHLPCDIEEGGLRHAIDAAMEKRP